MTEMNSVKEQIDFMLNKISQLNANEKTEALVLLKKCINAKEEDEESCEVDNIDGVRKPVIVFTCGECHKNFRSEFQYYKHLTSHNIFPVACRWCRKLCESLVTFEAHTCAGYEKFRKKYKCPLCEGKFFQNKKIFMRHIMDVHTSKCAYRSYKCSICGLSFPHKREMFTHYMRNHQNPNSICYRRFKSDVPSDWMNVEIKEEKIDEPTDQTDQPVQAQVQQPLPVVEPMAPIEEEPPQSYFYCSHCPAYYIKKNILANHMKKHIEKPKDISCLLCRKTFLKVSYYRKHMKSISHRNKEQEDVDSSLRFVHCCHICKKLYSCRNELTKHMVVHSTDPTKWSHCLVCDFKTRFPKNLKRHVSLHTDNRKFVCENCGKCFRTSSALREHRIYAHQIEKNHSCEICGSCFKLKNSLTRHYKTHSEAKGFMCFCGQAYKLLANLRKHEKDAHGNVSKGKKVKRIVNEDEGYKLNSPRVVKDSSKNNNCNGIVQENVHNPDGRVEPLPELAPADLQAPGTEFDSQTLLAAELLEKLEVLESLMLDGVLDGGRNENQGQLGTQVDMLQQGSQNMSILNQPEMMDQHRMMEQQRMLEQQLMNPHQIMGQHQMLHQNQLINSHQSMEHQRIGDGQRMLSQQGMLDHRGIINHNQMMNQRVMMMPHEVAIGTNGIPMNGGSMYGEHSPFNNTTNNVERVNMLMDHLPQQQQYQDAYDRGYNENEVEEDEDDDENDEDDEDDDVDEEYPNEGHLMGTYNDYEPEYGVQLQQYKRNNVYSQSPSSQQQVAMPEQVTHCQQIEHHKKTNPYSNYMMPNQYYRM